MYASRLAATIRGVEPRTCAKASCPLKKAGAGKDEDKGRVERKEDVGGKCRIDHPPCPLLTEVLIDQID